MEEVKTSLTKEEWEKMFEIKLTTNEIKKIAIAKDENHEALKGGNND